MPPPLALAVVLALVCLGRAGPLVPPVPLVTGYRVAGHPGYPDPVGLVSGLSSSPLCRCCWARGLRGYGPLCEG
jgi:hypothetical protein